MIQSLIHKLLLRRHFWRHATFSEVAELYASRLLRMVAMQLSGSFMSIYLYQQGYSIIFIAGFWAAFYAIKVLMAIPATAMTAWIGPKHAILASNILFIPSMIAFALLPEYGPWLLVVVVTFQGLSALLYGIAYNVDFSKVKSVEHAGKEFAYMNIVEKVATGMSPLIGGALAFFVGPVVVMFVAAVLFGLAAVPLLRTGEPVKPRQRLRFKRLPWHLVRGTALSQWAYGFDVFTSATAWSLYVAIFIIGVAANNDVYLVNGILMSVVLLSALASSYVYGKLIDGRRGRELLRFSVIANALTHLSRPFVVTPVNVASLNVANEAATTGYAMSYNRGIYDNADLSGQRALYLGVLELIANAGASCAALTVAVLVSLWGESIGLQSFFIVAAAVVLLILTARIPMFKR